MKKLRLNTIGLSLLFAFAGCSDSNNILSPADELSLDEVKEGGTLSKASAQQTVTLQLQPIAGAIEWRLQAKLTANGNGQFRGSGKFGIKIPLGGIIFLPAGGVMQMERNSSGEVSIELRARGQEQGAGRVRLRFSGSGTRNPESNDITGSGEVQGGFSVPDLRGRLSGVAQIVIDYTGAG